MFRQDLVDELRAGSVVNGVGGHGECGTESIGAGIDSSFPALPLKARMQGTEQELQRFAPEKGGDSANDDNSTGEDHLSCNEITYPSLARLAKTSLAIPALLTESERGFL